MYFLLVLIWLFFFTFARILIFFSSKIFEQFLRIIRMTWCNKLIFFYPTLLFLLKFKLSTFKRELIQILLAFAHSSYFRWTSLKSWIGLPLSLLNRFQYFTVFDNFLFWTNERFGELFLIWPSLWSLLLHLSDLVNGIYFDTSCCSMKLILCLS